MNETTTLQERIANKIASFQVGDLVNIPIITSDYEHDVPDDIDGRIVSIDGRKAQIETKWGVLLTDLCLCHKVKP